MATKERKLEMAPEPTNFLDGEFFRGMCEIAGACATEKPLYIPDRCRGLFMSLFGRRIFGKIENEDGSVTVGNFNMKNKYLYNYDINSEQYTTKKEKNFDRFLEITKEIVKTNNYKVFSLEPVKTTELQDLVAL